MLSNKEVVDIVASAPSRSYAARALVELAVRAWRFKYPTSKVDDCAVVCLFLDSNLNNLSTASTTKSKEKTASMELIGIAGENEDLSRSTVPNHSGTIRTAKEIVGEGSKEEASEGSEEEAALHEESGTDWSALEGVSRVNTLVTLPRFVPEKEEKKATGETKARKL